MSNEIIVTAHAGVVDGGNTGTILQPGTQQFLVSAAQQFWNQKVIIEKEADVQGDDITVIGNKLKQVSVTVFVNASASGGGMRTVPIIGSVTNAELVGILRNIKFTVSNQNFGEGRGGENRVGEGNSAVPVVINVTALRGYDALVGGLEYLIWHEVAHALVAMQNYNAAMWDAYRNGPGKDLTAAEQVAQYPESDQFKANEARANTIARALAGGGANWNFTPTNGYQ